MAAAKLEGRGSPLSKICYTRESWHGLGFDRASRTQTITPKLYFGISSLTSNLTSKTGRLAPVFLPCIVFLACIVHKRELTPHSLRSNFLRGNLSAYLFAGPRIGESRMALPLSGAQRTRGTLLLFAL